MKNNDSNNLQNFKNAYAALNESQRKAVDTIEGPVMVVAGPGTGKTQILTLRIANILLKTDTKPDGILALTFTESGAKAMRERLRRYIGAAAYQVPIFTFHGFAQSLIRDYPDYYQKVVGGRPANDIEKIDLIEQVINDGEVKALRPMGNPSYYTIHVQRMISSLKQENISPDALLTIIHEQEKDLESIERFHIKGAHKGKQRGEYTDLEKTINKNRELAYIYRRYEALMIDAKLFDFDDMILETVKAIEEHEDMRSDLQERYLYLLADEHQDVNGAQNKIIELLATFHDNPNIFAVGDEKQAIYRFQGASLENFLFFTEQFKGTEVISLTENYRSGQPVLDVSHSLVEVDGGPLKELRIPLKAQTKAATISTLNFNHEAVENDWLIKDIETKINDGSNLSEIAVIVRTNREVESISSSLRKVGIRVNASADGDILRHPITEAVFNLIDVVIADKSEEALFVVLHGAYWGIKNDDLLKVLSARSYRQSLVGIISDNARLEDLNVENKESLQKVMAVIDKARELEVHDSPHRVLEYILKESGLIDHVIAHDSFEGTRVVRRLYDEIEESVLRDGVTSLRQISQIFARRKEYNLPLNAPYISTTNDAVQVMTAHKSKGLEFETVYIPHLTDNNWSGTGKKQMFKLPLMAHANTSKHDFLEDERRLLYVAFTRAKKNLTISYSETNADGKELLPARLLSELDQSYLEIKDTNDFAHGFNPVGILTVSEDKSLFDVGVLTSVLCERGFSATSLNNYLRSPWDYFYRNVIRIPEVQPTHMQYGTAVHNTLEKMTRAHTKAGALPNDTKIKEILEYELSKLPVTEVEYVRLLEKGLTDIVIYRDHLLTTLPKNTKEEYSVRVMLETGLKVLPEIPLTGKLDRLDLNEAGELMRVVDYKTGKPKSRNHILGNTKDSHGDYHRQLVFYSLLLSLQDDARYVCNEGVLSFVESDKNGTVKEEAFSVTHEEVQELKQSIIESVKQIVSGEFLSNPCDDKVSDYCHLASLLKTKTD